MASVIFNANSHFFYTRNRVVQPKLDRNNVKNVMEGQTYVCCKKLG